MEKKENPVKQAHDLHLLDRRNLALSGVTNVDSFNETSVVLETTQGDLQIAGKNLAVSSLNVTDGTLSIEGEIESIRYRKPGKGLKRLFQ